MPFVSKATGAPLAKIAARVMAGQSLKEQGFTQEIIPPYYSVKEVVLPFAKFPGVDPLLGPEMRSTGEVMGWAAALPRPMPRRSLGPVTRCRAKGAPCSPFATATRRVVNLAAKLLGCGYDLDATHGTAVTLGRRASTRAW